MSGEGAGGDVGERERERTIRWGSGVKGHDGLRKDTWTFNKYIEQQFTPKMKKTVIPKLVKEKTK